jgi:hypothetical protein
MARETCSQCFRPGASALRARGPESPGPSEALVPHLAVGPGSSKVIATAQGSTEPKEAET